MASPAAQETAAEIKKARRQSGFPESLLLEQILNTRTIPHPQTNVLPHNVAPTRGRPRVDITGQRFGCLTILSLARAGGGASHWNCRCDCGNERIIRGDNIRAAKAEKCVCARVKSMAIGGATDHPLYSVWQGILQRCLNPKSDTWSSYGGRGIGICERWKEFNNFTSDMGVRPEGAQIDRIDNDRGYSPENCRWATPKENCRNRRSNRLIAYEGRMVTVTEAAELSGIPKQALFNRLASKNSDVFRPLNLAKHRTLLGNDHWKGRVAQQSRFAAEQQPAQTKEVAL